jgi:biofilm PGA synthesis protein PgaA
MTIDVRICVLAMAATLLVGNVAAAAGPTREAAVEAARRGEYDTAISSLRALAQAAPTDTAIRFDLAVVLQWAGRHSEATDLFENTRAVDAPEYVLSAIARAYRDQQRWTDAAKLAAEGARRFPASAEWPLAARLIEAGAALETGDLYGALRANLAALALAPDDARLQSEVSGILVRIGAPFVAGLHAAVRDPGIEARPRRRSAGTPRVAARRSQGGLAAGRRPDHPAARRPRGGTPRSRALDGYR